MELTDFADTLSSVGVKRANESSVARVLIEMRNDLASPLLFRVDERKG